MRKYVSLSWGFFGFVLFYLGFLLGFLVFVCVVLFILAQQIHSPWLNLLVSPKGCANNEEGEGSLFAT